jgi:pyruvate ferredoxin oxidoreductase beta subunit
MTEDKPAVSIKDMLKREPILSSGHRMCAGCAAPTVVKLMGMALRGPTIVCENTGCLEVATTIYPYTAWEIPWIHVAFENAAAVASGAVEAINAMRDKGRYKHDHVDIQRSGATFPGQETTTSWGGSAIPGKLERKKPLAEIVAAHKIPYVATVEPYNYRDFIQKFRKALEVEGPAFIHAYSPCPRGWRSPTGDSISLSKLAVETGLHSLYEVIDGEEWILSGPSKRLKELKPVDEYFKTQGQFKHLFRPEWEDFRKRIQEQVSHDWELLKKRCGVE